MPQFHQSSVVIERERGNENLGMSNCLPNESRNPQDGNDVNQFAHYSFAFHSMNMTTSSHVINPGIAASLCVAQAVRSRRRHQPRRPPLAKNQAGKTSTGDGAGNGRDRREALIVLLQLMMSLAV